MINDNYPNGCIVLIDADSLMFAASMKVDSIEDACYKLDETLHHLLVKIEEKYMVVENFYFFGASKGNFRKSITRTYKANRKDVEKPEFLPYVQKHCKEHYSMISAKGEETDDIVARTWKVLARLYGRSKIVIATIDKDFKQLPAIIYDYYYKKQYIVKVSPIDARRNFYTQMIVGDGADNVNYCKGYGFKYCEKIFENCRSIFSFQRKVLSLYKKLYPDDYMEKFRECYKLLKIG